MRIQVISDVHTEFQETPVTRSFNAPFGYVGVELNLEYAGQKNHRTVTEKGMILR